MIVININCLIFNKLKVSHIKLFYIKKIKKLSRVLAKQYKDEVDPWKEYLPILEN